jgi:hypothetical protein
MDEDDLTASRDLDLPEKEETLSDRFLIVVLDVVELERSSAPLNNKSPAHHPPYPFPTPSRMRV